MKTRLNLRRLTKDEIIWRHSHFCKHGHTYLEHPACLVAENPKDSPSFEKIGFFDIESEGLNANWAYVISYAIYDGKKIYGRVLTKKEIINPHLRDKNLMKEMCNTLRQFDRVIVYWGGNRRHDIPFSRTRCLKWGIVFPLYGEVYVTDLYDVVRNKLKLQSNRMEVPCALCKIPAKTHPLNPEIWEEALSGTKRALNYIWIHNKEDVISMYQLWCKLEGFIRKTKTSI